MTVENDSYAKFCFRVVRSFGRRLGENPDELGMLLECQREIDAALLSAVTVARESYGLSWADVGQLLGVTRQAAQQRFGQTAARVAVDQVEGQTTIDDQLQRPRLCSAHAHYMSDVVCGDECFTPAALGLVPEQLAESGS